jgi:hypothetical protein
MQARDKYSERVEVTLARSVLAEGFIALAAWGTATLTAVLPIALELRAAALGWIAASSLMALRRMRPNRRLCVDTEGRIEADGVSGELADGSFVAAWLAVIRWRAPRAWWERTLVVAPDMLPAEDFRRLRVILRWRK